MSSIKNKACPCVLSFLCAVFSKLSCFSVSLFHFPWSEFLALRHHLMTDLLLEMNLFLSPLTLWGSLPSSHTYRGSLSGDGVGSRAWSHRLGHWFTASAGSGLSHACFPLCSASCGRKDKVGCLIELHLVFALDATTDSLTAVRLSGERPTYW